MSVHLSITVSDSHLLLLLRRSLPSSIQKSFVVPSSALLSTKVFYVEKKVPIRFDRAVVLKVHNVALSRKRFAAARFYSYKVGTSTPCKRKYWLSL